MASPDVLSSQRSRGSAPHFRHGLYTVLTTYLLGVRSMMSTYHNPIPPMTIQEKPDHRLRLIFGTTLILELPLSYRF